MKRTWQGAFLFFALTAALVPASAWADDAAPGAPAPVVASEEGVCSLVPEPIPLGYVPPAGPTGGPCQVQTECPSPAPGVLGRMIGCWGDFYCSKSNGYWVECDYSREYC